MSERGHAELRTQGRAGAAFCLLSGMFLAVTAGGLGLSRHDFVTCLLIGVAMGVLGIGLAYVPWQRYPPRTMLVVPATVLLGLFVLGLLTRSVAQSFLALLVLMMVFVGLTQPPGTSLYLLPFLVAVWWVAYPEHPSTVMVRMPLSIMVWLVVGELVARYAHQAQLEVSSLRSSTLIDPLTKLGNRRRLAEQLGSLPVSGLVMFLDLDHFKDFNDRHGHQAGDEVLERFSEVLRRAVRHEDLVARFGGEEFVVVLSSPPLLGTEVYERIRALWVATSPEVTFSAGLAQRTDDESPQATMSRADAALYRAKAAGRDRLVVDVVCVGAPLPESTQVATGAS